MSNANQSLAQPISVTVGGKSFTLSPLTPNDFARTEQYITESRLDVYLNKARFTNLSDEVRAKAMADIICAPVDLSVILRSPDAQLYAVWLAIKEINKPNFNTFKAELDGKDFRTLVDAVMTITGMIGGESDEDPLGR